MNFIEQEIFHGSTPPLYMSQFHMEQIKIKWDLKKEIVDEGGTYKIISHFGWLHLLNSVHNHLSQCCLHITYATCHMIITFVVPGTSDFEFDGIFWISHGNSIVSLCCVYNFLDLP